MAFRLPEKPSLEGLEQKWSQTWADEGTFRFRRESPRGEIYAVDTPPPTVSGSLHVGHVFSYTHTDILARFHRMRGKEIFYPMGWDDNGLPTERRVQNYFGVLCDPQVPYAEGFVAPEKPPAKRADFLPISRRNFIELCLKLTEEDEKAFEHLWRHLGLSVDWDLTYATVGEVAQRVSQRSFLRLLAKDLVYQVEAPTLWDVDFRTAVAQAEIEDRERPGAYYRIRFPNQGDGVVIETTRPELLPACVALVAHPEDERYRPLFGTEVTTPLFGVRVPVVPHPLADPEKGSGIAMICTFGDTTDIVWWRELKLPLRAVVGRGGTLEPVAWGEPGWESEDADAARRAYGEIEGLYLAKARARVAEMLEASGDLLGEPRPIQHAVKFYEKGDRPLEIVTSRQWFIRTLEHRDELLARGAELEWHPPHMQARYDAWVQGLNSDWCISRQRFFGVPFPVWYPVRQDGTVDHAAPLVPAEDRLPVDPQSDVPEGYEASQRGKPGGFIADPDVMDTWATSSLTPQIAAGWCEDDALFRRVFPMALRPQAHEIIRTWLFSTVVRSHFEHDSLPWKHAAISGWVLDPDRKKMSKSKGNVVTPVKLLETYGSDAVRYWAANGRLGVDTAFDEGQIKVGRRLAIKILNATKFVLSLPGVEGAEGEIEEALDRSVLAALARLVEDVTRVLEGYDYSRALEWTEKMFWSFCDNYLELVKSRAYGNRGEEGARSAHRTLLRALATFHRLFAPHLPFVSEEVWSWWQEGSVHLASWPRPEELTAGAEAGDPRVLEAAADVLGEIRKAKTAARVSLKTPVARVAITDTAERLAALAQAEEDLKTAGNVDAFEHLEGDEAHVTVELAEEPAAP